MQTFLKFIFQRARAATTQSQGDPENLKEKLLPTVFKWEGGGKDVYISGTFNQWRAKIPLAKRYVYSMSKLLVIMNCKKKLIKTCSY